MKLVCFVCLLFLSSPLLARHGRGGSLTYQYLSSSNGSTRYRITIKHYVDCHGTEFIEPSVFVAIYGRGNNLLLNRLTIPENDRITITKTTYDPCIDNKPEVCYVVVTYIAEIDLPDYDKGYILAEQECCRINGIINVLNSGNTGITNYNVIPGVIGNVSYTKNSSPLFAQKDTAVICHSSHFSLDFSAVDPDGDSLSYSFCPALSGGTATNRQPNPPPPPPYTTVTYFRGFSPEVPLGDKVTINDTTGELSGIAPDASGSYVVAVQVNEFRKGVLIGTTKKEMQVTVADCSLAAALLNDAYINCDNYTFNFQNESQATNITSYYWDFGVSNSSTDTSTQAAPTFTYSDTGTYKLKLVVNSSTCTDSSVATVKVYPGFKPSFIVTGSCYQSPFEFSDETFVKYGTITTRSWDFGDTTTAADVSSQPNPTYKYNYIGSATAVLKIETSKGCSGTFIKTINISDRPYIQLPFKDTLICSTDSISIPIQTSGSNYSWRPLSNIINPGSKTPIVFPKDTTSYMVTVRDKACVDSAMVTINVVDSVSLSLQNVFLCRTDTAILNPVSDATQFIWTEPPGSKTLDNDQVKAPAALPLTTTTYFVTAHLGHCFDTASATVFVSPYPVVHVSPDTTICYGDKVLLSATTHAAFFTWSPTNTLFNANTLTPVASPNASTQYTLTVLDTSYCKKSVSDTVTVNVLPMVKIFAGNDTSVVVDQPLQLTASYDSSYKYSWSPATGMYNAGVYNPVVTINSTTIDSITYTVTASTLAGCKNSDDITVKMFKTAPDIFVPSAFTPNADGKNDFLKPVLVGIGKLDFFRVYDRWGLLLFSTKEIGKGWDGTYNGLRQATGTYVYIASAKDYTGKPIFKKGTVVLLR